MFEKATGKRKKRAKLSVTSEQEKTARLNGLEKIRTVVVAHLDDRRTARNTCIAIMVACIIVSFVVLRYIRAMQMRVVIFSVIAIAAVAASTIFTTAIIGVRKSKAHVVELDGRIDKIKRELGLVSGDEEDATVQDEAGAASASTPTESLLPAGSEDESDDAES